MSTGMEKVSYENRPYRIKDQGNERAEPCGRATCQPSATHLGGEKEAPPYEYEYV